MLQPRDEEITHCQACGSLYVHFQLAEDNIDVHVAAREHLHIDVEVVLTPVLIPAFDLIYQISIHAIIYFDHFSTGYMAAHDLFCNALASIFLVMEHEKVSRPNHYGHPTVGVHVHFNAEDEHDELDYQRVGILSQFQ